MTTDYQQRATIAVPESHIPDANQIALCLGESSADDQTFGTAHYQDASGNLYAVASTVAKPIFAQMAGQPLTAPNHSPNMDLEAATRAQVLLSINQGEASPDKIAVILGDRLESAQDHIAQLGLEPMQVEMEI
ncbi:MAG: hypothetical protein CMF22_10075 [Idiomarinaceae bacterium]|nr:hypothetical protein [Idiomarinaceae bacterium]MBG23788.1 hypothetical protein [Idiomarinaceae bacterium]|tara:strand:+ start:54149 stop:54547 length:399 start_codon:yes stop_codon:yes gene_type:complete